MGDADSGVDSAVRSKLPIGIQAFREIREEGHYCADKTPQIERLVEQGKHFFLSRLRRFGKSLRFDTSRNYSRGSEALFRGLAIHDRWDWGRRFPAVRLSFGGESFTSQEKLERDYAEKYRASGESIHPISIEFSEATRNTISFDSADA